MTFLHSRHRFTILFVLCCIVYSTESRYRDKERNRKPDRNSSSSMYAATSAAMASTVEQINLCSRQRDMKLMCYCTPDETYIPVNKAECWIFQQGLQQNDSTWQRFYQQKKLRHLKFLVQNTGYLDYIPTKYLEMLPNLTTLGIEYSQIRVVKGYALASLPNLELITLTNNLIEILDKDAFANHIFLRELNLQRNQITEMDRYAFRNLPMLQKLFLSWNNISNLHEGVFSELGKLEDLSMQHNLISVLTGDMFKGLGNLKTLKLTHNNLNFIGDTVFAELWSLQELELDDNRIERISERALDGLNNLKTLNLRNNVLKKLDNGLLRGTPALLSINLQENLLETLTYYNFQPIMDNLVNSTSELFVSDNNFICDCRLQWIFDLRNRTRNINLKESLEEIVCTLYDDKISNLVVPHNALANNDVVVGIPPLSSASSSSSSTKKTKKNTGISRSGDRTNQNQWGAQLSSSSSEYRRHHQDQQQSPLESSSSQHQLKHQHQNQNLNQNHQKYSMGIVGGGGGLAGNEFNNRNRAMASAVGLGHDHDGGVAASVVATPGGILAGFDYNDDEAVAMPTFEFDDDIGLTHQQQLQQHLAHSSKEDDNGRGVGRVVELLKLRAESLPCPEELSDPTELPLSRESIGMDVRGPLSASGSSRVQVGGLLLLIIIPVVMAFFLNCGVGRPMAS